VPYTHTDIDALKRAIATGARKVRYESNGEVREVTYRDQAEMERTLLLMETELSPAQVPARSSVARHNRF
jgi:hypothetical protein